MGQDDMPVSGARSILGGKTVVGASAGNPRELRIAVAGRPDYLSFGPVFSTSTKVDAGPPLGLDGFRALVRLAPRSIPILAVGGVTPDNVDVLFKSGADAVAIASWWWRCGNPARAVRRMLGAVAAARKSKRRAAPQSGG